MGVSAFLFSACTDLAFVPALFEVARHRRHFELFVGVFQLYSSFMYNLSQAVGAGVFLRELDWHLMSDILTLTYVCCLLVHCMGNGNENINIGLRYLAFSCAWMFKVRDSWDSTMWEAILVVFYLGLTCYGILVQPKGLFAQYDIKSMNYGAACLLAALFFVVLEVSFGGDSFGILQGCTHLSAASTAYFLWKAVPSFDEKKNDDVLRQNATFV